MLYRFDVDVVMVEVKPGDIICHIDVKAIIDGG